MPFVIVKHVSLKKSLVNRVLLSFLSALKPKSSDAVTVDNQH